MPKIIKNGVTYIGTSDNAAAVSYDNTSSGLTATNVQGAIDEVNAKDASDIAYDNTTSGLTATDVNAAIDEVNSGLSDKMDKVNPTGSGKMLFNAVSTSTGGTRSVCLSYNSDAKNNYSACVGGYDLVSGRNYQTVFGLHNEEDTSSAVVVGWGSSTTPKNIFTLSTTGAGDFAGTIDATGLGATLKQAVIDTIYPVGSIYMSIVDDTAADVINRFGGTWVKITTGRVLIGANSTYPADTTGGSATTSYTPAGTIGGTKLTAAQSGVPQHTHALSALTLHKSTLSNVKYGLTSGGFFEGDVVVGQNTGSSNVTTAAFVSGTAGNNTAKAASAAHDHDWTGTAASISTVQPWYAVYMDKRTA